MKRRDFLKRGIAAMSTLAVGETIQLFPGEAQAFFGQREVTGQRKAVRRPSGRGRIKNDYARATVVKGVCMNCSSACGIQGYVIDGRLAKIAGNPEDPNNGHTLCAKGQSGPTINVYPERLLYPLKRVGARGEGLWQRITWDEAYDEIARRIRKAMDEGVPEEIAIHVGRSRYGTEFGRFLAALGSKTQFNHRAICSSNKRAANYVSIGETDWESVDAANTKYLLNFGSNFYEAHQGSIHFAKRVVQGRFDNGAKLVTFDVRLSNTAGRSDEWFAPNPGSEGAIALGMAHAIMASGQYDREFLDTWSNIGSADLEKWLSVYTPEWAAEVSGIPAADIRRLALEFAAARPQCAAFTNRGSGAHYNGFYNDRAVILLNAIVGSIGRKGGYTYTAEPSDGRYFPDVAPRPPRPTREHVIENPPEWPLANKWQRMRVGQIVYDYLKQGRGKLQVYFTYTLASPSTWPEGRSLAVEVLQDDKLIPFHVCSDIVYSETAHYADLVLPDATYMERWGFDTRNNYELHDYVTLRQPIVPPPGECESFVESLIKIAKRVGPDVAKYFPFESHEEWIRLRCRSFGQVVGEDGFEYMRRHGVWSNEAKPRFYDLFRWELTPAELEGTSVEPGTNVIRKAGRAVGIMMNGKALRGFGTPSRLFQVYCQDAVDAGKQVGFDDDGMPGYRPVPAFDIMGREHFHLVSFKWNVHTQGRTASQKFLSEIVHHNPLWINPQAAGWYGIRTGDLVEITTYRPKGHTHRPTGEKVGTALVPAFVTEGIHPRVIAISNSLGQLWGGRVATAHRGSRPAEPGWDRTTIADDQDISDDLWWDTRAGGTGAGYNVNAILPIAPAPLVGMQGWYDTVCTIRKA